MSYSNAGPDFDYARVVKLGFLAGVLLFAGGVVGELIGRTYFEVMPAMYDTVFVGMEILGVLVALIVPILFGIVLPLIE